MHCYSLFRLIGFPASLPPYTRSATGHAQYTTLPLLWFSHSLLACCPGFYLFAPFVLSPPRGALVVLPRPVLVLL